MAGFDDCRLKLDVLPPQRYHRVMSLILHDSLSILRSLTVRKEKRDMAQIEALHVVFAPNHHMNVDEAPCLGTLFACLVGTGE